MHGIYAITDEILLAGRLEESAEAALQGGIRVLQYRNKNGTPRQRLDEARRLAELCAGYSVPLLINDDISLCQASGAAGVHLGQRDGNTAEARSRLGDSAIIGVTCHNDLALARQAENKGASYVAFGRFYPSHTKPGAPAAQLSTLIRARQQLHIPIVAIGGINAENGASLLAAGADMLAVIHFLFSSEDITSRVRELGTLFQASAPPIRLR